MTPDPSTLRPAKPKLTQGASDGHYDVTLGGEAIGSVYRRTERYNIAPRPLTVTYWRANPRNGDDRTSYSTRRDALAALVAHHAGEETR